MQSTRMFLVVAIFSILSAGAIAAEDEAGSLAELVREVEQAETWSGAGAALARAMEFARRNTEHDALDVRTLEHLGRLARRLGEPHWAVELHSRAFDVYVAGGDKQIGFARNASDRIGGLLEKLGELEQAERWARTSIGFASGEKDDSRTANAYRQLSRIIGEIRPDDPEAHEAFLNSLVTSSGAGRAHQLADFYASRGEPIAAVEQQLARLAAQGDEESWDARRDLAQAYRAAGQPELAGGEYDRALVLAHLQFGERDAKLIELFREVGEFYLEQGRHAEAESILIDAYEMAQVFYGNCPVCAGNVAAALRSLSAATGNDIEFCDVAGPAPESEIDRQIAALDEQARARVETSELAKARGIALEALELRKATYGVDSPQYTVGLSLLIRVSPWLAQGDARTRLHQERIAILEALYPGEDILIATDLGHLGRQAEKAQDYETAESYLLRRAYALEANGRNLSLASSFDGLADLAEARGDVRQAAEYQRRVVDLWELMAEKDSEGYARAAILLAGTYRKLGLAEEAEELLLDLAQVYEDNPRLNPDRVDEALQELYTDEGLEATEPLARR